MEVNDLNVFGIWAYDGIWALAKAVERVGTESPPVTNNQGTGLRLFDLAEISVSQSGRTLLNEILQTKFRGLSGEFQIMNGKLKSQEFEIVNVIGKGERTVGFWTSTDGIKREMYRSVHGLETIIWPGGSTIIPKGWMMSMSGKKLRVGVPTNPGFKELVHVDQNQANETTVTGFCIAVFKAAIEALPFEVPYEFIPFVGADGKNLGTYNDLTDQVYLQKYDAAVGDMTITSNRSLYVDFTLPYTDLGVGMIVRKPIDKNMWIFLKPLDADLWLTSAAFFILTGFVVWVIEHPKNREFQGSPAQQIGIVFWFSFSTLVFAHREKLSSNLSKFVVIIWLFVVLILTSSYTATLSSLLTVQQIQLASKGEYIGYQSGSFLQGVIVSNFNFKDDRLEPYSSPDEYANALSKGSKSGGVDAIFDEIPYIKIFLAKYSADYDMIGSASKSTTNGFGFVFQKGSPLVPEISRAIAKLREEGKLEMMEKIWFNIDSSFMPDSQSSASATNPSTLSLDSFRGLFLISGIASAFALFIFFVFFLKEKIGVKNHIWGILAQGKLLFMMKYLFTRNAVMIGETNAR
ncbi:unnamed protein product [Ilex paraguariensis]|uniref:Ionotropic glutamate receptor C-terminal domain-containing protein n=1 Tax=Ilex paraguariensis TaxID=185542 RepID=A0ABC8RBC1_9AQUA